MEHNQEIMEQFLKLLSENGRAGQSEDLSRLLFYMDGMSRQLNAVHQELQSVKVQLAQAQDAPKKTVLQGMVDGLQNKVRQAGAGKAGRPAGENHAVRYQRRGEFQARWRDCPG